MGALVRDVGLLVGLSEGCGALCGRRVVLSEIYVCWYVWVRVYLWFWAVRAWSGVKAGDGWLGV